jgi:mono/diheme cytochrome c family protein
MLKYLVSAAVATAIAISFGYAQSSSQVTIPVKKTEATSGKQMFMSYCAPCHGTGARGDGPVAASLKTPPFDLTTLSKKHGGQFPDKHVLAVLQFGVDVPSHGSTAMPVWGPVLGSMSKTNSMDRQIRINNLVDYLKSIQVK